MELASQVRRELLLKDALYVESQPGANDAIVHQYDYILIDPPPSLGVFTYNALVASTAAIVPLEMGVYAWNAMPQLEGCYSEMQAAERIATYWGNHLYPLQ